MLDLVTINENHQAVTTSVKIAEVFGKEHKSVIRAINNIIGDLRNLEDGGQHNFAPSSYINLQRKEQKQYIVTRDGFTLLAMGFTGKKALEFKIKYIAAFNAMEAKLKELANVPAPVDMKAIGGLVKKCCAVAVRDELRNILAGDSKSENWEVSDQDLIYQLYHWHSTKNKAETLAFRKLYAERDALLAENADLKNRMEQISAWVK